MKKTAIYTLLAWLIITSFSACGQERREKPLPDQAPPDSTRVVQKKKSKISVDEIVIEKAFLYDQYTLPDVYPYKDTTRLFQWDKIKEYLALISTIQVEPARWAILQNKSNINGISPLVRDARKDPVYNSMTDAYGVERYQAIPLFPPADSTIPERYARDGSLVKYLKDTSVYVKVQTVFFGGDWIVPRKYVKLIDIDPLVFNKVIVVDRTNQNIATLENTGSKWLVRSMNPATTGLQKPPYKRETPLGIFVIQEKRPKMIYLKDGTQITGGFAPYASRFSSGGFIHGIPVNAPGTAIAEYSPVLGTTPRSHMCVRNATSHAKYIYDWAPVGESLVVVIE